LFGTKFYTYKLEDWIFTEDAAKKKLLRHFETASLKGFGSMSSGWVSLLLGLSFSILN